MSEAAGLIPTPQEFYVDGFRFVQYGISPVRMAALKSANRKAAKGTRKNPIIKDGKEYVYTENGNFVLLEHLDRETVAHNKLPSSTALTKEKVARLREFSTIPADPDEECPELSEEEISEILREAMLQREHKR